jgi:hypothetical protein
VDVDEDHRCSSARFRYELFDEDERVNRDLEEELALEVDDRDRRPVPGVDHGEPAAGRRGPAEIRGAKDAVARLEERDEIALPPDVIPRRDHVRAGGEELLGELGREPDAVRRVLAVHDAEVDAELLLETTQARLDGAPAGRAEDVTDEENPQG